MATVTIYTTQFCPYCMAAKQLLSRLEIEFDEIGLDGRREQRRELSESNGGWRTVPMVFIGDIFIGGFDELNKLARQGNLEALLTAAAEATTGP